MNSVLFMTSAPEQTAELARPQRDRPGTGDDTHRPHTAGGCEITHGDANDPRDVLARPAEARIERAQVHLHAPGCRRGQGIRHTLQVGIPLAQTYSLLSVAPPESEWYTARIGPSLIDKDLPARDIDRRGRPRVLGGDALIDLRVGGGAYVVPLGLVAAEIVSDQGARGDGLRLERLQARVDRPPSSGRRRGTLPAQVR